MKRVPFGEPAHSKAVRTHSVLAAFLFLRICWNSPSSTTRMKDRPLIVISSDVLGKDIEQCIDRAREAILCHIEGLRKAKKPVPREFEPDARIRIEVAA